MHPDKVQMKAPKGNPMKRKQDKRPTPPIKQKWPELYWGKGSDMLYVVYPGSRRSTFHGNSLHHDRHKWRRSVLYKREIRTFYTFICELKESP